MTSPVSSSTAGLSGSDINLNDGKLTILHWCVSLLRIVEALDGKCVEAIGDLLKEMIPLEAITGFCCSKASKELCDELGVATLCGQNLYWGDNMLDCKIEEAASGEELVKLGDSARNELKKLMKQHHFSRLTFLLVFRFIGIFKPCKGYAEVGDFDDLEKEFLMARKQDRDAMFDFAPRSGGWDRVRKRGGEFQEGTYKLWAKTKKNAFQHAVNKLKNDRPTDLSWGKYKEWYDVMLPEFTQRFHKCSIELAANVSKAKRAPVATPPRPVPQVDDIVDTVDNMTLDEIRLAAFTPHAKDYESRHSLFPEYENSKDHTLLLGVFKCVNYTKEEFTRRVKIVTDDKHPVSDISMRLGTLYCDKCRSTATELPVAFVTLLNKDSNNPRFAFAEDLGFNTWERYKKIFCRYILAQLILDGKIECMKIDPHDSFEFGGDLEDPAVVAQVMLQVHKAVLDVFAVNTVASTTIVRNYLAVALTKYEPRDDILLQPVRVRVRVK